jgi:phage-related baseplate assembly protein
MRNIVPSSGGFDRESVEESKKRAPQTWSTHGNIVSDKDYAHIASSFRHPVYGGVLKAVAAVFTSRNANIVELSILGAGENGDPVTPSLGLREGLATHIDDLNVATDEVRVVAGSIKPVDVEINVVLFRNADSASVKNEVDAAIDGFFAIDAWEMGQPLYVSTLYDRLMGINGVRYVDIFKPVDDILPAKDVEGLVENVVSYNELIRLGSKDVRIYYEKTT